MLKLGKSQTDWGKLVTLVRWRSRFLLSKNKRTEPCRQDWGTQGDGGKEGGRDGLKEGLMLQAWHA